MRSCRRSCWRYQTRSWQPCSEPWPQCGTASCGARYRFSATSFRMHTAITGMRLAMSVKRSWPHELSGIRLRMMLLPPSCSGWPPNCRSCKEQRYAYIVRTSGQYIVHIATAKHPNQQSDKVPWFHGPLSSPSSQDVHPNWTTSTVLTSTIVLTIIQSQNTAAVITFLQCRSGNLQRVKGLCIISFPAAILNSKVL